MNAHKRSRPTLTSCTRPALASTCRCCVTDCRVISVPAVNCAIDIALPAHNTAIKRRRVSSPSAAKTGAALRSIDARATGLPDALLTLGDMLFEVGHLLPPPAVVHTERFVAARGRQLVEA
ncbi:hypothetical protein BN2475_190204 [Paraburkholderia ribeironis]|uniref:Uncharacterized protein n=1 Tax=Paraburkholderia ribeironis TaxID=1247936 RepID=A0A1N7RW58_9BURK|nr:hypothetical protein BN2475_190204 [Paraburkholderia ribeironis]